MIPLQLALIPLQIQKCNGKPETDLYNALFNLWESFTRRRGGYTVSEIIYGANDILDRR